MNVLRTTKYYFLKFERFMVYRVMSLDDTPHRIALGVAIGIFVTWTPTIGLQMIITILLATLLKANKFVGVPFVWISNPVTFVPIYGPNYWLGATMMGKDPGSRWQALFAAAETGGNWIERTGHWFESIMPIFWELWLGSLVVSLVLGIITYFLMYRLIIFYRTKLNLLHLGRKRHTGEGQQQDGEKNEG